MRSVCMRSVCMWSVCMWGVCVCGVCLCGVCVCGVLPQHTLSQRKTLSQHTRLDSRNTRESQHKTLLQHTHLDSRKMLICTLPTHSLAAQDTVATYPLGLSQHTSVSTQKGVTLFRVTRVGLPQHTLSQRKTLSQHTLLYSRNTRASQHIVEF